MSRKRSTGKKIVFTLLTLGALFFLFLGLRSVLLDLRFVPSDSMLPTLQQGEWILVNRFYGRFSQPARGDLVMFERPGTDEYYLKRVVGLPGEKIQIAEGDLFIDGRRAAKSVSEFHDLAVTVFDSEESRLEDLWSFLPERVSREADGAILLRNRGGEDSADLTKKGLRLDDTPGSSSRREARNLLWPRDASLSIRFETPPKGVLFVELGEEGDHFRFEILFQENSLHASLSRFSRGKLEPLTQADASLQTGKLHRIEVGNVDNRLFLQLDEGDCILQYEYERNSNNPMLESHDLIEPPSSVIFGFSGGEIRVQRFTLYRDLDYTMMGKFGIEQPCELGPEQYFLLGDNSPESQDSRFFGPVNREAILGKPIFVVFPISRIRKL